MNVGNKKDDRELVESFKNGCEEAFDELAKRYSAKMFQTAFGLTGNRQDAEEVVQDALIRAYRSLHNFRGDSSFSTWVFRIVVNLSRNKYHWNRRRGAEITSSISEKIKDADNEPKGDFEIADSKFDPFAMLQNVEAEKNVVALMKDLPEKLREVLILRHIEEKSYEQIAEILKCNLGTVKSRISRAREAMIEIIRRGKRDENGK